MWLINTIGLISLIIGLFKIANISFFGFIDEGKEKVNKISFQKKKNISQKIEEARKPKQYKGIVELIYTTRQMLILTGRTTFLSWISFLSISLFIVGILVAILMNNYFLIPIFAFGFALAPFIYVILISIKWQKELNEEMETALSIITTAYIRKEDIITAVADNVQYLNEPIKSVFESFLVNSKYINSNTKEAIRQLQSKIPHEVFKEWCEVLIACQENKEQKTTLSPIVKKISDSRIISEELNNLLYLPLKDYLMVIVLFFLNYPLLRIINKEWYRALTETSIGKITIAVTTGIILFTLPNVIMLTKSVSYKDE